MIDDRTTSLFHFNEPTGVPPSDRAGALGDMTAPAGFGTPTRVQGALGGARRWSAPAEGFVGAELVGGALALRRSMAVEAVVSLAATDGVRCIATRGLDDGTAGERLLWQLTAELRTGATVLRLGMRWKRSTNVLATVGTVDVPVPAADWIYIAAVRIWKSDAEVIVRYFVQGAFVGEVTSAHGDIADGDGGHALIGLLGKENVPGLYSSAMSAGDAIDEVRVSNAERTKEEIAQEYARMFAYPELGYELLRACVQPGIYSDDAESRIQRVLRVEGHGLGIAWATVARLLEDFLPDRATETLDRWETVTRLFPGPLDTVEHRRERVLGFLRKVHGYNRDEIRKAVTGLLKLTEAQLPILENTNTFFRDWGAVHNEIGWYRTDGPDGEFLPDSGLVEAYHYSGIARWDETGRDLPLLAYSVQGGDADARIRVEAHTGIAVDGQGLFVFNTDDLLGTAPGNVVMFGVQRVAGVRTLGSRTISFGVNGGFVSSGIAAPAAPYWIRVEVRNGVATMYYSTTGKDGPWTTVSSVAWPHTVRWSGWALRTQTSSAANVSVSDWTIRSPKGRQVFEWFIYRDPSLAPISGYDTVGANLVINKMKPAHTRGYVCTSEAFACDDPHSVCDRDPIGG